VAQNARLVTADRRFWIVCALGGTLLLVGSVLPTIEVGQGAYIGAGDSQRSFDYNRTLHFASYLQPGSLLFVLGGLALVALSIAGFVRGTHAALVLGAAALSIAFVVEAVRISDELRWSDSGVYACEEPLERCTPFIAPAIRDLQAEIRRRPEAREAEFALLERNGYRSRGKLGWQLILWTSALLAAVTLYRAFLLVLRPVWAGLALVVCALLALAYLALQAVQNLE
jgi:hypothetical protein